jgi:DnaJ-class molecular chaperone
MCRDEMSGINEMNRIIEEKRRERRMRMSENPPGPERCDKCGGSGRIPNEVEGGYKICPKCGGGGLIRGKVKNCSLYPITMACQKAFFVEE